MKLKLSQHVRTFGYVDYKNVIKWNLENALLCLVFADPVTISNLT